MPQVDELSWLQRYWPQILFFFTLGTAGVKNHIDTRAVKKAIFDKNGDLRLVKKSDCEKKEATCLNIQNKKDTDLQREFQNIHATISDLQSTVSDMPQKVAEHLKTMGVLK